MGETKNGKKGGLELFPHNREALDAAYAKWDEGVKRCCVVHAVGTGKSFIYHKLAEDNADKRTLVLSPTNYIFDVQRASVQKVCPTYDFEAYETRTYATNYKLAKYDSGAMGHWDYIVLDEFHRAGARTWSYGVESLLTANPTARVLGLSATPFRFSDSGRNMASELFDGEVVSTIMLPEAWARGILKKPRYILADYQTEKALREAQKMVNNNKHPGRQEKMEEILEQMKRSVVSSAMDLSNVFASGLERSDSKLIIFCRSVADLNEARRKCHKWFDKVNRNIRTYKVLVSNQRGDDPGAEWYEGDNAHELLAFNENSNPKELKLLFCIDALNEGIHAEGVNGTVLMRHTKSPTIFQQQIGRAMAAGSGDDPVIFDIAGVLGGADMIYNIQGQYRALYSTIAGGYIDKTDDFAIDDRIVEFAELNARMTALYNDPLTMDEMIDAVIADMEGE